MNITINIPDEIAAHLLQNPAEQSRIADVLTAIYSLPRPTLPVKDSPNEDDWERISLHFGTVHTGNSHLSHNEQIDADLAKEYGRGLDD